MLKGKYFLFVSFSDNDIFLWKFMRVINSIRLNLTFQHPWYLFIYSVKWLSYQVHNIIYQQVYLYLTYEMRHSSKYKNNISSYHLDYTYTCSIDKVRGGGLGGGHYSLIHLSVSETTTTPSFAKPVFWFWSCWKIYFSCFFLQCLFKYLWKLSFH